MGKRTSDPPPPPPTSLNELAEVAQHYKDRDEFLELALKLAKEAWNSAHPWAVPQRGPKSVADPCFMAIWDGYTALPGARWLENYANGPYQDLTIDCYERLPIGRLIKMIRDRHPRIKVSTARKYARIWERENQPEPLPAVPSRMALYRQLKTKRPALYTKNKPRSKSRR
jgi:hypothetical protein